MPRLKNSSKNSSIVSVPTAYSISSILLENHAGRVIDIQALVTEFTITESIYSHTLFFSADIKDEINFLQEFNLTGQEKITISLAREPIGSGTEQTIEVEFFVTEYPLFGKIDRVQAYKITAISKHAFLDKFKLISRAYSSNVTEFISSVFTDYLKVTDDEISNSSESTSLLNFVVPSMTPIEAIKWITKRAFTSNSSPFYVFQTLDGMINIRSQDEMVSLEAYNEYNNGKYFIESENKKDAYNERANRIINISSNMGLSKFIPGSRGAYTSITDYIDIDKKDRSTFKFNYHNEFDRMSHVDEETSLSNSFKIDGEFLTDDSSVKNTIHINSGNKKAYNSATLNGALPIANSYIETLDCISHDIELPGDFYMNAGKCLNLKLTSAYDSGATIKGEESEFDMATDLLLSGKYLITSVVHKFSEEYTMIVRVKKDTIPIKINE